MASGAWNKENPQGEGSMRDDDQQGQFQEPYGNPENQYDDVPPDQSAQAGYISPSGPFQPSQVSFQPSQGSFHPSQGSFQPGQGSLPQSQGSFQPGQGSLQQSQGSFQPGQENLQQSQGSFQPSQGSLQQSQGSFQPGQGSLQQSQGSFEPGQGSFHPSQGSFQPTQVPYQQDQGPYQQDQATFPPSQMAYQSSQGSFQPSQASFQQSQASFQPSQGSFQPSQESFQPTQMAYQPSDGRFPPTQVSYQPDQGPYQMEQVSYDQGMDGPFQGMLEPFQEILDEEGGEGDAGGEGEGEQWEEGPPLLGQGDAGSSASMGSRDLKRPSALCPVHGSYHDLEAARNYLKNTTMEDGVSLWAHTRQVIARAMLERPPAGASFFEDLSLRTRNLRVNPRRKYPLDKRQVLDAVRERIRQHIQLITTPPPDDCQWPGGGGGGGIGGGGVGGGVDIMEEIEGGNSGEEAGEGGGGGGGAKKKDGTRWQLFASVNDNMWQFSIGLPREEGLLLHLAMRKLCENKEILKIRVWGKIFGRLKNYYILEAEVSNTMLAERMVETEKEFERLAYELAGHTEEGEEVEGEGAEHEGESESQRPAPEEAMGESAEGPAGPRWPHGPWVEPLPPMWTKPPPPFPPMPTTVPKEKVEVPREPSGTGPNKKVYYVSNYPTDEWVTLPDVSPQQIVGARAIRRFFTGELNEPVNTYPPFPGKERHLLRAQIARITAGTQISPQGFYTSPEMAGEGFSDFDEESEMEGEGGGGAPKAIIQLNARYRPLPLYDLLDETGNAWLHHVEHILKQGRTQWWNPTAPGMEEEEEIFGEDEEKPQDPNAVEAEVGPPLLTPLSEDASLEATPPWTLRPGCSMMSPLWGTVLVRSNLWPGAWAIAIGSTADNIYVGFGIKTVAHSFTPAGPGELQREYPVGPEVMEQADPTPAEEEEWRKAHEPPQRPPMELMGEGEEMFGEVADSEESAVTDDD